MSAGPKSGPIWLFQGPYMSQVAKKEAEVSESALLAWTQGLYGLYRCILRMTGA